MAEHISNPLFQAAAVWKELTEYYYVITYGYKKQLYTFHLTFSSEDFPHLAGFQYLKDISLPRYNPRKIIDVILKRKITYEQIQKGILRSDKKVTASHGLGLASVREMVVKYNAPIRRRHSL